MIAFDRSKALPPRILSRNTAAPFAMLRGMKCGLRGGLGLGLTLTEASQFDPEPISRSAMQATDQILAFFRVGAGRMEADRIVPIQNQIHHEVLAPIAEAVNAPFKDQLCQSQLQQMLDALLTTEDYW